MIRGDAGKIKNILSVYPHLIDEQDQVSLSLSLTLSLSPLEWLDSSLLFCAAQSNSFSRNFNLSQIQPQCAR